jgi:hypothetical protein
MGIIKLRGSLPKCPLRIPSRLAHTFKQLMASQYPIFSFVPILGKFTLLLSTNLVIFGHNPQHLILANWEIAW